MPRIYITRGDCSPERLTKLPVRFVNPKLTRPQHRYLSWLHGGYPLKKMIGRSSPGREEQILTTLREKKLIEQEGDRYALTPLGRQVAGQFR